MQNPRGDVMSRLGGLSNQNTRRIPTVEYVNRAGERVNPHNGKPYSRPVTAKSLAGNDRAKPRRSRVPKKLKIRTFGVIFGGLTPITTNPAIDPPPKVCYVCWQPGHSRKDCTRPVLVKICKNCGRRGVNVNDCPRCQLAYTRYLAYMRGEKLEHEELAQLLPRVYYESMRNGIEPSCSEDKPLDDELQQLLEPKDDDFHAYDGEHEREAYTEPQVKYVETREYVKNPVSRHQQSRESEEEEEARRRYENYAYEEKERERSYNERDRSYDERDRCYDERDRSYDERDREEHPRYRERESSERSLERSKRENLSYADSDSDPVQDILQLAKSIAHLSPETQELIMKQVMAERKEKARLRAMQHKVVEDWP